MLDELRVPSYGGYMSLATLVSYSDRLRGGIDVVGISNFNTFLSNTSAYRQDLRRQRCGHDRRLGSVRRAGAAGIKLDVDLRLVALACRYSSGTAKTPDCRS